MTKGKLKDEQKNLDFVQIYPETFSNFSELTKENPISAQILFFLIQNMAAHNNAVSVSYTTLQELLGYSRPTLSKAVKTLEDKRYIEIIKQGTSNVYVINEKVAWRKARNQRQYAIFSATVVATSSENKRVVDNLNKGLSRKLRHVPRIQPIDHKQDEQNE